jgi:hypothetical protein
MTRARTASYGVVTPPPLDRWIDAVLMLCVSLVQGVATTFEMRFNRRTHDWHMGTAREALPQTKPDIQFKEPISGSGQHVRAPGAGRDPASAQSALFMRASLSSLISTSLDKLSMSVGIQGGPCGVFRLAASSPHARTHGCNTPA